MFYKFFITILLCMLYFAVLKTTLSFTEDARWHHKVVQQLILILIQSVVGASMAVVICNTWR